MHAAHRQTSILAVFAAGITLGAGAWTARADHAFPITDANFTNGAWSIQNYGNRNATAAQVPGGVSGNARQVTHPLTVGSSVQACHIDNGLGAQVDPVNGAIMALDFFIKAKFISGVGVNGHQVGLALTQNEIDYRAGALVTGTSGNWVQLTLTGLKDTDFSRFDGLPGTPDFSTSGQTISFGFRTGNGSAGQSVNQVVLYDDFGVVVHRGSLIVSESDPSGSDWDQWLFTTGSGGTFTSSGAISGGNPGICQSLTLSINAGTSTVEVLELSNDPAGIFDPQYGPIANMEFSMDFRIAPNSSASSMIVSLLFEQGGVFYQGPNMSSGTGTDWHTIKLRNLVAANFKRHDGLAGQPDFSTTGQPIRVGRRLQVSHSSGGSNTTCKQYVDNFTVRAHFIACPADLNGDNLVDDADFSLFVVAYNILDCSDPELAENCSADLNGDNLVNDADFVIFLAAYNVLECP